MLLLSTTTTFAQTSFSSNVSSFTKLKVDGNIVLTLIKSDESKFDIELTNIDSERFQWVVEDGEVSFKLRNTIIAKKDVVETAKITLYYNEIAEISAVSGAKVLAENTIEETSITLELSNKSVISLEVQTKDIKINAFNALVTISGTTEFSTIRSTGGASVNCSNLSSTSVYVRSTTNAECYIWAIDKIDAKANSNSNIFYKGDPEIKTISSSTLGAVQKY